MLAKRLIYLLFLFKFTIKGKYIVYILLGLDININFSLLFQELTPKQLLGYWDPLPTLVQKHAEAMQARQLAILQLRGKTVSIIINFDKLQL